MKLELRLKNKNVISMKFTYNEYKKLIDNLKNSDYQISNYHNYKNVKNPCILRHDVDYSLDKSVEFAEFEKSIDVKSTYFILLSSDFYNVFSKASIRKICSIMKMGHEIGLHFDETKYEDLNASEMIDKIRNECDLMSQYIGTKVNVVSMHRPSKWVLDADLKIPEIVNSYGNEFFHEFKYVSDSRMRWREDVMKYVLEKTFPKFHILTHAFWYFDEEKNIHDVLDKFLESSRNDRYAILEDNFTDLSSVIKE